MEEKRLPTFSIIVAVRDQALSTAENLPLLLTQQYGSGKDYEVIVVDEASTDNTADVLDQLKTEHPNLYTTFVPNYHFQKDRRRLALTIGAKAAKKEWVVIADITRPLPSAESLSEVAAQCDNLSELFIGKINTKKGTLQLKNYESIADASKVIKGVELSQSTGPIHRWLHRPYAFIVVKTSQVHELLKLFETPKTRKL
jgi:cellulose synthase/poly-beta-1,6-N-acetylglucosamine synthase-like glycosyltransferase